jgi:hypothetical protein
MKVSNNTKTVIKLAFLFFIVLSTFYVYYLFNDQGNIVESFTGNYDCSDCEVKPSSGNCIPIYDISYKFIGTNPLLGNSLTISNELTDFVFCEWKPSATCISNNLANLPSLDERMNYSSAQIADYQSRANNVTCCSGSTNNFYSDYTMEYETVPKNSINLEVCKALDACLNSIFTGNTRGLMFDDKRFVDLQQLQTNFDYRQTKSLCNDISNSVYKPGLLFKKTDNSTNIFVTPNILPKDLIDFIMNSNFTTYLANKGSAVLNAERPKIDTYLQLFEYLNDQLMSRQITLTRRAIYDDLTTLEKARYTAAKNDLKRIYDTYGIPSTNYLDIKYNLRTKAGQSTLSRYLLNPSQFFNCFGEIKQDSSAVFSASNLRDFSINDYFGTGVDASYSAFGAIASTAYPSNNDLQMELARLQQIPSSGNAPVSIINTYLNAINSFYQKQIQNLTGPRDHVFNQELVFDNNTLETATPTFFTYDDKANNSYQCQESVTGNSIFKDCGPAAYVEFASF